LGEIRRTINTPFTGEKMRQVTFADRLRYTLDNIMSRGTGALIASLGLISVLFVVVTAGIVAITGIANTEGEASPDFFELMWRSMLRTLDPGTMGGDSGSPAFLAAMFIVTLGGIFLVSILIGILTSGIESRLEELRKGRSFVIEQNHTLVLGWSSQVFTIISELVEANANQPRARIVVLAGKDKVEMEDEIRAKVPHTKTTRIVCRSGSPLSLTDLAIVNPDAARSIILLSPETSDPDTYVIKTLLALTNNPNRKKEPYHIVAEIRDDRNVQIAQMIGRTEAQILLVSDWISRITVQTCRQSGLSVVYTELLDFGGDEIYFKGEPTLVGKTFGETLFAYEDSAVIGVQRSDGSTLLNPAMDTRIEAGDEIIAISEDDATVTLSGRTDWAITTDAIQTPRVHELSPEKTLILGWNARGFSIVNELDSYVSAGSETAVVANVQGLSDSIAKYCSDLKNESVTIQEAVTTDRLTLDSLEIQKFDHIIVLSYSDSFDPEQADAQTLITLLHLRDIAERADKHFSIVSEMLDARNRELAKVTRADDFIVSDQLISLMLAQISENKYLTAVFADLFDPEGSEIYLKPAEDYILPGRTVDFYTVLEAARRKGEVAIGYRLARHAQDESKAYGVAVNPTKSNKLEFSAGDKVIVLAEN
jgi:ion channel POLLUX/CASTOR